MTHKLSCSVCGAEVLGQPWLLLNRWGIGTGTCRGMRSEFNADDDYFWEIGEESNSDDIATGPIVCWPDCAYTFIESSMIEVDVMVRMSEEGDV